MAALERPVPDDETNDAERDDGGRVRLSEAEGERDRTAYRQYLVVGQSIVAPNGMCKGRLCAPTGA
jgi:hypothetical protein